MSYEYEEINRAIVQQNGIDNNINRGNLLREIDEVYALAEKLPEYEAKAKAFDALKNNLEKEVETLTGEVSGFPYVDAPIESTIGHFEHVLEMMKKYESGGYDA